MSEKTDRYEYQFALEGLELDAETQARIGRAVRLAALFEIAELEGDSSAARLSGESCPSCGGPCNSTMEFDRLLERTNQISREGMDEHG